MEIKSYEDMAWQLGINTIETVHRMKSSEFVTLGEEMLKAAKLIQNGGALQPKVKSMKRISGVYD